MQKNLGLLLALTLLLPAAILAEDTRLLDVQDYFRIGQAGEARLSGDGRFVAYTVRRAVEASDTNETRIWRIGADGGEPVPMTAEGGNAWNPRWSPDGRYLAFLAERGEKKKAQVYTLFLEGGEAERLTDVEQGVESFEYSPDGKSLVLAVHDAEPEPAKEAWKEKTPRPWVVDRRQFKQDGVGYLDERRTHLYVFDVASKELKQVTSGPYDDAEPAISPDGRWIAFTSNRTADPDASYNTDVWVASAEGGEPRRVTANPGADRSPAWSGDGGRLVYLATKDMPVADYGVANLATVSFQGGDERLLAEEVERNVIAPRFSADGRFVYFLLEDGGQQVLARLPFEGGELERLVQGRDVVSAFSLGDGPALALVLSRPDLPPEVFRYQDGELRQLSRTNAPLLAELRLGEVEEVRYESPDGTPLQGFVVKPPGFEPGRRYPALLRIHGGPMGQYDWSFDFEKQLFAAHGYVVVMPNPRGSSGFGQAFGLAIWRAWGEDDYADVMAAVDDAIGRGYADPDRLGVGGHSYGGMLTNHVITKTGRFKAAVTSASAWLYTSNYGHDHYQRWWEGELGLPWRNRERWEKLSPFYRVDRVTTPTLVACGEKDWNVPVVNSEQLYQSLKVRGVDTRLVVYPGESHLISVPSYRIDLWERALAWYDRYVKGGRP